ncbi:hypothetical protein QUC31_008293 [Theobroma cacao]
MDAMKCSILLKMFDAYGNHVAEGVEVQFHLDGFVIQEHLGSKYKVDDQGCIDRGCLLKVTAGYGKPVGSNLGLTCKVAVAIALSVLHDDEVVLKKSFKLIKGN